MGTEKNMLIFLISFVFAVFLCSCATTPQDHPIQPFEKLPPSGLSKPHFNASHYDTSLWTNRSPRFFEDLRARNVGDLITVIVSEEATARKKGETNTEKNKTLSAALDFLGLTLNDNKVLGKSSTSYSGHLKDKFDSTGEITKEDTMTAYVAARVIAVEPNGNLVIRGTRWTRVSGEELEISLEGIVRPEDISAQNTVLSRNIADARIYFNGRGPITTVQLPGWASIILSLISPF